MRIADHVPVLQGSQVLQQPSNLVHQQQVQAPVSAKAIAAMEAEQHARQVNDSNQTEGRTIQDRPGGGSSGRRNRKHEEAAVSSPEEPEKKGHVSPPGSGKLVDIVV